MWNKLITKQVFILLIGILFLFSMANAAALGIQLKGNWNETAVDTFFIDGNTAYLGCGKRLVILNISDKSSPLKLGETSVTDSVVSIFVSGNYAYVIDSPKNISSRPNLNNGLRILDVSDPAAVTEVAFYNHSLNYWTPLNFRVVVVSGNYAYVGTGYEDEYYNGGTLEILDITDPVSPQLKGFYSDRCITDIVISGNLAYCSTYFIDQNPLTFGGIEILDISNREVPKYKGETRFPGNRGQGQSVSISGTHAFVANFDYTNEGSIEVVNISKPQEPKLGWSYFTPGSAEDLQVDGDFAYLADGTAGVRILDIAHPYSLYAIAYYETEGSASCIYTTGGYIYVAAGSGGFYILKASPGVLTQSRISLDKTQLYFGAVQGTSINTGIQEVSLSNSGAGTLNWTTSTDAQWINVSPQSGKGDSLLNVSIDPAGLTAGSYNGKITVTDSNAENNPQEVSILLEVYSSPPAISTFGVFETPVNGSTVMSSIPVTGWVLDRIGVERVGIYRRALEGEGNNLIHIGDATFVEGARPDVETSFPGYPNNSRAGWGYMLLTNFLPGGGNGTVELYAVAVTVTGREEILGSKTIICDNEHAVKPFGAIDTPEQGGIASGNNFINWGWALTPQPNTISVNGRGINVYVDGVYMGHAVYNIYRADIEDLFPGYANSNGAAGYYSLESTAFKNGIHTIQWAVTDDYGNSGGVGSRYFSIQNFGTSSARSTQAVSNINNRDDLAWAHQFLAEKPVEYHIPIRFKKGICDEYEFEELYPDENGIITVESRELERIEISLQEAKSVSTSSRVLKNTLESQDYTGYLLVGNELRPLPIGSFLDKENGIYYWGPGPGFKGLYQFVFIHPNQGCLRRIDINILPKY